MSPEKAISLEGATVAWYPQADFYDRRGVSW